MGTKKMKPAKTTAPKHTPGPWEVLFEDDDWGVFKGEEELRGEGGDPEKTKIVGIGMASYLDDQGQYQSVHRWEFDGAVYPEDKKDHAELLANARVMAAAPDLLAALKKMVCATKCGDPHCESARAAIAQAEGRR